MEYRRSTDCSIKRLSNWRVGLFALVLGGLGMNFPMVGAQAKVADDSTIFQDRFEADVNGWMGFGPHFHIGTTNEAGKFKSGMSALAFNYRFEVVATNPGELPIDAIVRPIPNGQLAKMRSLSFWAKSDINAPLTVALTEKEGGRYTAVTWIPKNQWVHVVLLPEDFALADGKDDPKDPDGKLDMDQVENISLLNMWEFLPIAAKTNPASVALFPAQTGEHTLWLDDFTASSVTAPFDSPEPLHPETDKNGIWIDGLRRDALNWLPLGSTEMQLDKSAPTKSRAIRLDYSQEMGKVSALVHDLHNLNLTKYDHLEFDIAGSKPAKLVVSLEERGGARYNTVIDLAGGNATSRKALYFSDFKLADDSPPDPNNRLDLDQLKSITILDFSGFVPGFINPPKQEETLWIGPIRATKG